MVEDVQNKTTPVRVVFNSSQNCGGMSLNKSLEIGPEVMQDLPGILLRFREDQVAAMGDIKKMFYGIRVTKEDQFMQLWCWQFSDEQEIRTFMMTRLVMGNGPSTAISIISVKETAHLLDFAVKYPYAKEALCRNSYVDNVNVGADNLDDLDRRIAEVEFVAAKGGHIFKPWVKSGDTDISELIIGHVPECLVTLTERNLGIYWNVTEDLLKICPELAYGGNRKSGKKISILHCLDDFDRFCGLGLVLKDCLSIHAKCYDPLGLALPVKMQGNILFRKSLQQLKVVSPDKKCPIQWDALIPKDLLMEWFNYFKDLHELQFITFPRASNPADADKSILPKLITFSDGNEDAFGTVAYALFTLVDGSRKAVLLGSKAKLCPLTYKAEVVKSELSGSTFASRLRQWLEKETGKQFGVHVPILDSQIVQAMIKKDSYIYNTFAGLRVKEIQDKTDIEAWLHVPSAENIADLLTKGTSPENINTDSIWQNGPSWLLLDQTEWPITKSLVKKEDIDKMNSFIKKSHFQQSLSSKTKQSVILETDNKSVLCKLAGRCGSLSKFLRVVARLRRCIKDRSFKSIILPQNVGFVGESLSAAEISDAWNYVIAVEQKSLDVRKLANLMPVTVKKLLNDGSEKTHIVIGNRMKKFPIKYQGSDEIPFLQVREIAQLVVRHYHDKYHCDIDTLVTHIRNDVWIPGLRKLVVEVDKSCVLCIEKRRKFAGQVMGQLPEARTEIQPPFTNCLMDLFGPIVIKDDCVKRGPRVHKKVWGIVFTCASTRALYLDVATDYSSEAIMHAVRRLKFHRGNVKTMVSDPGTQLVAADKELKNWRKGWNEDELQSFGAKEGLVWSFIMPASKWSSRSDGEVGKGSD